MALTAPLNPMPPVPVYNRYSEKPHPGSFGIPRHQHAHTGVDLYAPMGAPVHAMEAGKVIRIAWFTGLSINMPWWNDTRAVYIEGETGVFNYGEIQDFGIAEGDTVQQGQMIGYVIPVLRKWKGRPMSMLHVELYDHGWTDTWGEWKIGDPQPEHLKDPTELLLESGPGLAVDPYRGQAEAYAQDTAIHLGV